MNNHSKKLFERLYVPVVSFIKEIVGDREEAKNIAVEIFARDIDEINNYDGSEDLTEITQVLLKKSLIESFIFLRKEKREKEKEAEKVFQQQAEDLEASVEDAKIERELRQLLEKAGGKLAKQQNLVLLHFFSGIQTADAARILEISQSTFRNTKRAALKKVKAVLRSGGFIIIVILLILIFKCH
jgi:RNA polymerase sigma factor (sigma-70 family)